MDRAALMRAHRDGQFRLTRREVVQVTTTPTELRPPDSERVRFLATNLSGVPVTAFYDKSVSTSKGVVAGQNGGGLSEDVEHEGEAVAFPVYAVVASGTADVLVMEWRAVP